MCDALVVHESMLLAFALLVGWVRCRWMNSAADSSVSFLLLAPLFLSTVVMGCIIASGAKVTTIKRP